MEKITVTLPEDVALWVRARATQSGRSVSRWLADFIEGTRRQEDSYDVAMEGFLRRARQTQRLEWSDGRKPSREELHDRAGLR